MRWSRLFIPTLREIPADAGTAHHQLLLRAGFIRQLEAGIYAQLPLARRSYRKVERIVREEMDRIGAQEFHLPVLNPPEFWKETFTLLARDEIRSYKDLPQIWYQIQVKVRDEPRPKSGLLSAQQLTMQSSYSFDLNRTGLGQSYTLHREAYRRILDRCGLRAVEVQAPSVTNGGSEAEELAVFADAGEDRVVHCLSCHYAADLECATALVEEMVDPEEGSGPSEVHTPDQKTIQEVSDFLNVPRSRQIKSLVYVANGRLHLILLRGDHQLSAAKLTRVLGTDLVRPGLPEEIREAFQADPGSLGPVGLTGIPVLADLALKNRRNMICGANRDGFHLLDVTPGVDFGAEYEDLRQAQQGDPCPSCKASLAIDRAIKIGHVSKLGTNFSHTVNATVLAQDGSRLYPWMGHYEIGVEYILAAAAETCHDELGLVWPRNIAPFQVVVALLRPDDPDHSAWAEKYLASFEDHGIDCLLDDRDERPGVKFKDAELIGFPVRITIGRKLREGQVEVSNRATRETFTVAADSTVDAVLQTLEDYPF